MPKRAYIGVDGVAREIKEGYIGVCETSQLSTKSVGDIVKLNISGVAREFIIVNQGNPDATMYDASCDGIWLMLKDPYFKMAYHSADGGDYENSDIHAYLNSTFLQEFDSKVQAAIKQVKIPYLKGGGQNGTVVVGENGLTTKIFLTSYKELNHPYVYLVTKDGAPLSYFKDGEASKRIAYADGVAVAWRVRNPRLTTKYPQLIAASGADSYDNATKQYHIRPMLIMPTNLEVDGNGLITGNVFGRSVARRIKKGYIGVNGVARECFDIKSIFSENTWEEIIAACRSGSVPDTWLVGDQKTMTINGVDYTIDIIGKNHDEYADGSGKAPLTFQMHDCYADNMQMNSTNTNAGGWTDCAMRNTHLPALLALMPSEVQAAIKEVNKKTSAGSQSASINTTADKLFLLSEIEVYGSVTNSFSGEGIQYEYYSAGNSKPKNKIQWSRSPYNAQSISFVRIYSAGYSIYGSASFTDGVAFAFCF